MVAPWGIFQPGGVSSAVAGLGGALERSGRWNVHYLELADADSDVVTEAGRVVHRRRMRAGPAAHVNPRQRLAFIATLPATVARTAMLIRNHGIDVVNVHFPTPEAWLFAALRRRGLFRGKLLLSVHGMDVRGTLCTVPGRAAMRWIYESADAIVACSNSLARELPPLLPAAAERVHAVHNGIDPWTAPGGPHAHQRGPSAVPHAPTLLSVATFEPKKGLDVLLDAFAICRRRHPGLLLRMIGQRRSRDPTHAEIVARVAAMGLRDCIEIETDVPNRVVREALRQADVLVLPSRQEPFGLVLLEAGLLGTPIVASEVDGIPEVLPSDDYGLLVRPEDPGALAEAIQRVLADPGAAHDRAINMKRRVVEHFTWDAAAARYEAILSALQGAGNISRVRPDAR